MVQYYACSFNCANPSSEDPRAVHVMLWEDRYCRLQSFLKMLDQSDQCEYVQTGMLSKWRNNQLSFHWRNRKRWNESARSSNVLGTYEKNVCTPSTQQKQLHI